MKLNLFSEFNSLDDLVEYFHNDTVCKDYLASWRWSKGCFCPYCGSRKVCRRGDGRRICIDCNKSFSAMVGTVFQSTKLPLKKWYVAIYLFVNNKNGLSSIYLMKMLKITQKTAWFMLQKIRGLLRDCDDFPDVVCGKIEPRKSAAGGAFWVRVATKPHRLPNEVANVVCEGSRIYTDEYLCYQSLAASELPEYGVEDPFPLRRVADHERRRYVVNGFWQQLKRMISGTYHYVSLSLFHRYVYEAKYRYKRRMMNVGEMFCSVMGRICNVIKYADVRPR